MKTVAILIISGLALIAFSFFLPDCRGSATEDTATTIRDSDTIYVRDTVYVTYPAPTDTKLLGSTQATLPIYHPVQHTDREPKNDEPELEADEEAELPDSITVNIHIEQRHYLGDNYEAWVSGYNPALDSLRVFPETRLITTTTEVSRQKTKRWGLSVGAGVVATPTRVEPGIFIGATYTFFAF